MSASPLRLPSFTAVVSLIFAVTGFSYIDDVRVAVQERLAQMD